MTPKELGFRMPAEWAPHERTWMMWPSREEVWDDMDETCRNYAAVAHAIRRFEPLTMLVRSQDRVAAHDLLGSDIDLLDSDIDDSWARDAGPCFLLNDAGEKAGVSFEFNAWGEQYAPYDGDNKAAAAILEACHVPMFSSKLIAEGGGLSVDGEGTLLTTRTCFPNPNRNPDWDESQITQELKDMLGVEKVIWLPGSELETETNGHVDGIAVFAAPGLVLMEKLAPSSGDWYRIAEENLAAMAGQTDAQGRPLRIVEVPDAEAADSSNEIFCRSYVNSYILNDAVIMPAYGVASDGLVQDLFADVFPGREIVPVPIPSIAIGGGGIHCITQQEPKGV